MKRVFFYKNLIALDVHYCNDFEQRNPLFTNLAFEFSKTEKLSSCVKDLLAAFKRPQKQQQQQSGLFRFTCISAAFTKQSLFWFGSLRQPLFYISIGGAGNPFRDIQSKRPKPWQGQNTNFENVLCIQFFFLCYDKCTYES